jgi:hypothetical protein
MDVRIHDVGVDRPRLSLEEFPWRSRVLGLQLSDGLLRRQYLCCLVFRVFGGTKGKKIRRKEEIRRDSHGS